MKFNKKKWPDIFVMLRGRSRSVHLFLCRWRPSGNAICGACGKGNLGKRPRYGKCPECGAKIVKVEVTDFTDVLAQLNPQAGPLTSMLANLGGI